MIPSVERDWGGRRK